MYCANCGNEATPSGKFCPKCGANLPAASVAPPMGGPQPNPPTNGSQLAQTAPASPQPARKSGRGCLGTLGIGCLGLIGLLVVVGGGGFLAYRSHLVTPAMVLNLVGLGPANLELDNFRDDAIAITIAQVEVANNKTPTNDSLTVKPLDISAYRAQNPGRYRVDFHAITGGVNLGACTLTLRSGDQYQFVALPGKVVVNRASQPSTVGSDFLIQTSSLCR